MKDTLSQDECSSLLNKIIGYSKAEVLPDHDTLFALIDKTVTVLEKEPDLYREHAEDGKPGGLLDFTSEKFSSLPVIIVPDLHARAEFMIRLLESDIVKPTVLDALNERRVIVICVGDGVHAENRAYDRWRDAYSDWMNYEYTGRSMTEEVREGIATMGGVMELKCAFPQNFHFLKGNHENIMDNEGDGDHSFRKFALEGEMVRDFIREVYGDVILHIESCFERALPVCAICSTCGVSHAEPLKAYSKKEIINYHQNPSLILGLTWTANDEAVDGGVRKMFKSLNKKNKDAQPLWFGGHRPVPDTYLLRQEGAFIQIHNPDEMNVAVVTPGKEFNPDEDILSVLPTNKEE